LKHIRFHILEGTSQCLRSPQLSKHRGRHDASTKNIFLYVIYRIDLGDLHRSVTGGRISIAENGDLPSHLAEHTEQIESLVYVCPSS
jgi:hypothetical protein